jgi:4-amino-4-deoxy-L-arabinose transferase-like glycosyltransferase
MFRERVRHWWRPAPAIAAIVILAAILRVWGVAAGAPFRMGVDEPVVLSSALRMMRTGSFNPHFFDYGGFVLYLQLAVGCLRFLAGAMAREWASLEQIWIGDLLVWARMVSVVLGTATVYVVYCAGRRWGQVTALTAALMLTVLPQHVRESHFALTDTPLTFLTALVMLLAIRAAESGRVREFFWAGLAVGACTATKYNGLTTLIMPLLAVTGLPGRRRAAAAVAILGAATGFLVSAPFTVLDLPAFLDGFARLMQSYNGGRGASAAAIGYLKYMRNWFAWPGVLSLECGWIELAVAALGLIAAVRGVRSAEGRARALVLVIFPFVYFTLIARMGGLQYGRYAMPLLPGLAIGLGLSVQALSDRRRAAPTPLRRLAVAAPLLLLGLPLANAVTWNVDNARTRTIEQAAGWLTQHAPRGAAVVIEGDDHPMLPPAFHARTVRRLIDRPLDAYRRDGVTYLVSSSAVYDPYMPGPHAEMLQPYRDLLEAAPAVQVFAGTRDHPGPTVSILKLEP